MAEETNDPIGGAPEWATTVSKEQLAQMEQDVVTVRRDQEEAHRALRQSQAVIAEAWADLEQKEAVLAQGDAELAQLEQSLIIMRARAAV